MKKLLLLLSIFGLIFTFILFIAMSIFLYDVTGEINTLNQSFISKAENSESSYSEKNNAYDSDISCIASTKACVNTSGSVVITIPEFIDDMQCCEYTLKPGDTLTSIAQKYISTCTLNSSIKLIKEASHISNSDLLSAGTKIKIPETVLCNGYIHKVVYGDTWDKLCKDYYPIYNSDYMSRLLIFINNFPDSTLPLGTEIYLPNVNI